LHATPGSSTQKASYSDTGVNLNQINTTKASNEPIASTRNSQGREQPARSSQNGKDSSTNFSSSGKA